MLYHDNKLNQLKVDQPKVDNTKMFEQSFLVVKREKIERKLKEKEIPKIKIFYN
jgi:hypothetical protein